MQATIAPLPAGSIGTSGYLLCNLLRALRQRTDGAVLTS
jgi:hypothetical protein